MSLLKPTFHQDDIHVVEKKSVYHGFFNVLRLRLKHRLFAGGWTTEVTRELLDRGDACAAVLYDPIHDTIGLIEQFRVGAIGSQHGPWCLEVVAGMVEAGETPEQVIHREIEEESGLVAEKLLPITHYFSSPGGSSESVHVFCALCDLKDAGGIHGLAQENEDILLRVFPANDVFSVMFDSRMNNAATLIALQWLSVNKKNIQDMAKVN